MAARAASKAESVYRAAAAGRTATPDGLPAPGDAERRFNRGKE